jgi:endonuclease YncB( thermonuclease family)
VLHNGREQVKIHLYGIDCLEKGQAWASRTTQATGRLCTGKVVDVQETDIDRYGRTVP